MNGKRFGIHAETRNEMQFATPLRMTSMGLISEMFRQRSIPLLAIA